MYVFAMHSINSLPHTEKIVIIVPNCMALSSRNNSRIIRLTSSLNRESVQLWEQNNNRENSKSYTGTELVAM